MSDYTPSNFEPFTDDEMREIFLDRDLAEWAKLNPRHRNASGEDWDAWLKAHDAEVRYRALREAEEAAATSLTMWWLTPTSPDEDADSVLDVRRAVRALQAAGDREYRTVNGRTESRMKEIPAGHWVPVKQEESAP